MPYETKKYQRAHLFLNEFLSTHYDKLETDFDLESKEDEFKTYPADDGMVWYIKKIYINHILEFVIHYHNMEYLRKMTFSGSKKIMTNKEYSQRKISKSCYVYKVDQHLEFIPSALLKNKYNKVNCQFIHDNYWFMDFETKHIIKYQL